jgi:hypothetical protein
LDDKERQSAFLSALATEHFVLQTAANATVSDAAARTSLYVVSLSSTLVALGFASRSREVFVPFVAIVLPALFVLGIFTIVRLVDSALENMRCLIGIARIRAYYRTLTPEASEYFAARRGRWPEGETDPSLGLGQFVALFTTSASMIAVINSVVAGTGVAILAGDVLTSYRTVLAVTLGVIVALILIAASLAYERWRFSVFDIQASQEE